MKQWILNNHFITITGLAIRQKQRDNAYNYKFQLNYLKYDVKQEKISFILELLEIWCIYTSRNDKLLTDRVHKIFLLFHHIFIYSTLNNELFQGGADMAEQL